MGRAVENGGVVNVGKTGRGGGLLGAAGDGDEGKRASSAFFGAKFEKVEGMEITRATGGGAGAAAFTFNHKAGTATVRPPAPSD